MSFSIFILGSISFFFKIKIKGNRYVSSSLRSFDFDSSVPIMQNFFSFFSCLFCFNGTNYLLLPLFFSDKVRKLTPIPVTPFSHGYFPCLYDFIFISLKLLGVTVLHSVCYGSNFFVCPNDYIAVPTLFIEMIIYFCSIWNANLT